MRHIDIDTSENSDSDDDNSNSSNCDTDNLINLPNENPFMYLPVKFEGIEVRSLLDTGCSINVISQNLFNNLPHSCKTVIDQSGSHKVQLADSKEINIVGTSYVRGCTPQGPCGFLVYILPHTSNPLILGTEFMRKHRFVLDFGRNSYETKKQKLKIRCNAPIQVKPNSECVMQCKLPKSTAIGVQGVCLASKFAIKSGLLVAMQVGRHCL